MTEAGRKRWWRVAVAGVVFGAGGAWLGFNRPATAESHPPVVQLGEHDQSEWLRVPTAPAAPSAPQPPAFQHIVDPAVVPAGGVSLSALPAIPPVSAPPLPAIPPLAIPVIPVVPPATFPMIPAVNDPVTPGPRAPDFVVSVGGMVPPEIPSLPGLEIPPVAKQPATPEVKPVVPAIPSAPVDVRPMGAPTPPGPVVPAIPVADSASTVPAIPLVEPVIPPLPGSTTEPKRATGGTPPVVPVVPPVVPVVPAIPSGADLPKLPEPPAPISGLPAPPVKPDNLGGSSGPVTPPAIPPLPGIDPVKPLVVPSSPVIPPIEKPGLPAIPTSGGSSVPAFPATNTGEKQPGTVVDRPRPVMPPLTETDKFIFPLPTGPTNPLAPTPGDNPVTRFNPGIAAAVIGGFMLAPMEPAKAGVPPFTVPNVPSVPVRVDGKTDQDKTEKEKQAEKDAAELKKQVEESNRKLTTIGEQLKTLTELLNGKKDEKGYPLPSDPGVVAQMKEFGDRLKKLEKDLEGLKTQTSLRPPMGGGTVQPPIADPKAGKGTVRVVNEYPVQISIVVNGTSHKIPPTKSLDIDVTAGEFTYQLLESGAAATKSIIKEKETVTLRIK